jgi:transposase
VKVIQFSPRIYVGETIYSIAARLVLNDLSTSVSWGMANVFGNKNLQLDSVLPSFLRTLSAITGCDTDILCNQHSLFPYYAMFASNDVKIRAKQSLLEGSSTAVHKILGLLANRLCEDTCLKFCPYCAKQQECIYGEAVWLRHHQLPLVTVCLEHGCQLVLMPRQRKCLVLPDSAQRAVPASCEVANKIAEISRSLLSIDNFDLMQLQKTYAIRLVQKGLATEKTIYIGKWRQQLREYYAPLMQDERVSQLLKNDSEHGYPANIFYHDKATHHPIKHILILCFLFEHYGDFVVSYSQSSKQQSRKLSQDKPPLLQIDIDEARQKNVIDALKQNMSLRNIIKQAKVSAATVRNIAHQAGIQLTVRKRKLQRSQTRVITIKLIIGRSVEDIATETFVTKKDVEQVLTGQPELKLLRQQIRHFKRRQTGRSVLCDVIANIQHFRVKDAKEQCYSDYMWLYKNDRDWLENTITAAQAER